MSAGANYTLSYYSGFEDQFQEEPHFLQLCFLCTKPLGHNSDIFMYRGNTPFCSQDCRQEQIEFDEANERSRRVSSSKRSHSHGKSESKKESAATGTVAVA